ncbi:phostensin, partial [Fukomys damarensis]|uniref:phostensin n=1 Tax=Fukomys damarensis TaxID=885580 RepID=UPI00053FB4F9
PGPGNAEPGPADPEEPAVLLEAIGPVHQNRFIRQERQRQQQRNEELLAERKPGPAEARERRPSPGEARGQSPKGREAGEDRLSPREARGRRLGTGPAQEHSPKPVEARDWRQSRGEEGDRSTRLPEPWRWRLSPEDTKERSPSLVDPGEQSPPGREAVDSSLGPGGSALAEAREWRLEPREPPEQRSVPVEAAEWRLSSEEREGCVEEHGREEHSPAPLVAPEEIAGPPEAPSGEPQDISRGVEMVEQRPGPVEAGERGLRSTEGWKWTLNSGKAREWTARDTETPNLKPDPPGCPEHRLEPRAADSGEGEAETAGAGSRPLGAPGEQDRGSVPSPLPSPHTFTVNPRRSAPPASPATPATPAPGNTAVLGPGKKRTFTVNPRRSAPPASPATPATPAPGNTAVLGPGKKRYPTAEEILVLGGYLRLSRSCLVKGSPERHHKQLRISFSETALETTYQYPSESSVLEELGPEPEAPRPPAAQPDDEEDEEELLLLHQGSLSAPGSEGPSEVRLPQTGVSTACRWRAVRETAARPRLTPACQPPASASGLLGLQ